eukprot:TRINITY_DN674_c0_g1_i1.p2 TRINITY_DN674_c0_g1~~TRINITY_DN674_c0_g1_i1.p2  ORF type:complete len:129 (+),score=21.29 TRINITY_DN674_c0_g1_i1:151-537(+)
MARNDQPSAGTTVAISGFLFLITLSGLMLGSNKLASAPQLHIVGGFISSLLFVFALLIIGNLERETKWPEVILSLFIAMIFAASVHRVSVTTCVIFSLAELAWLNAASKKVNEAKPVAAAVSPQTKKR